MHEHDVSAPRYVLRMHGPPSTLSWISRQHARVVGNDWEK